MNILFCGDHNAEKGVLIAILSLLKQVDELHIYILTMTISGNYQPFSEQMTNYLTTRLEEENPKNTLEVIDCSALFAQQPPTVNMRTRFTPYAMLRLFADQLPQIPDRILYLDDDVIIRRTPQQFYEQPLEGVEMVGVLDYWGRFFFHNFHTHRLYDYLNSGVLLLNMKEIKRVGTFKKVRQIMATKRMFLPDQSALNKAISNKRVAPRCYNEQYRLRSDTVIQHFTTSFRFKPYLHTLTVKPWEVDRMHQVLHLHEYDDILTEYLAIIKQLYRPERISN